MKFLLTLPDDLHQQLKDEAWQQKQSLTGYIRNILLIRKGKYIATSTQLDVKNLNSKPHEILLDATKPLLEAVKHATCPICHLSVPADQSQQHYAKEHSDI